MTPQWYLARNRQKHGPYSWEELKQYGASGLIAPTDMLLQQGAQKWVPAHSLAELFPTAKIVAEVKLPPPPRTAIPPCPSPRREITEAEPDTDEDSDRTLRPALWNPNVAACWSLVFTPVFGAYLVAANWRVLGKPRPAAVNMVWVWAMVAYFIIGISLILLTDPSVIGGIVNLIGLGLLLGWYFSQGRSQARYLKEALPGGYVKKSWLAPLGIAAGALFAFVSFVVFLIAFAVGIAVTLFSMESNDLAARLKSQPPRAYVRKAFHFEYPGAWTIDEKDKDYDPDHRFSIDASEHAVVRFTIFEPGTDPSTAISMIAKSYERIIPGATRSKFMKWGRYEGEGMTFRGKVQSVERATVRVFAFNRFEKTFLIVEYVPDDEKEPLQPGFRMIEDSFQVTE